jgi:hypothetical protein
VDVLGQGLGSLAAPSVTGPIDVALVGASLHNGGVLVFNGQGQRWRYGSGGNGWGSNTATRAELDARFGNGTYTVSIAGTTIPLTFSKDFSNAPMMTLAGGEWSDGKYVVAGGRAVTVTTNPFAGWGTDVNDVVGIQVIETGYMSPAITPGTSSANVQTIVLPASARAARPRIPPGVDLWPRGGRAALGRASRQLQQRALGIHHHRQPQGGVGRRERCRDAHVRSSSPGAA